MRTQTNLKRLALAICAMGIFVGSAQADTVNGRADAVVIEPLSITENISMDFGTVAGGPAIGTVVLDVAGARTTTGDAEIIAAGAGAAGDFTITGQASQAYTLSFSASATLATGLGPTMTADTFTDNSLGTLPAGGSETFQVGATLNVGASQAAGNYSTANGGGAPYTVTVNYN